MKGTRKVAVVAVAAVASTLVAGLACASGADPGRDPVTVRDSAGIEIVESFEPSWPSGSEWIVTPEPTVVIGAVEGNRAHLLSRVVGAVRLSDGRIAVLDSEAQELRLFGPDGEHVGTLGGPGEGPGEFSYPSVLERLPGEILQVVDRLQRVRFASDGGLDSEETLDWGRVTGLGSYTVECGAGLPLFYRDVVMVCPRTSNDDLPDEGLHRRLDPVVVVPWDLSTADTLGGLLGLEQYALQHRGRRSFAIHSLYSRGLFALDPEGERLYLGETGRYEIRVWSLDGRFERIIRRPGTTRPPTPEEVEEGYERAAVFIFPDRGNIDAVRGHIQLPDSVPPIQSIAVDAEGYLWVGTRSLGPAHPNRFEVFAPDGRLLGGVELPAGVRLVDIGVEYVLGVRQDELGVPFVELYALHRGTL